MKPIKHVIYIDFSVIVRGLIILMVIIMIIIILSKKNNDRQMYIPAAFVGLYGI